MEAVSIRAAGTYYPDKSAGQSDNERNTTFSIPASVAVPGGFAQDETGVDERNWAANETILSVDIDGIPDTT